MSEQKQVPKRKREIVSTIQEHMKSHETVGLVEMEGIGAKTVQRLRADLRDRITLMMAKNTLMKKAIELMDDGEVEGKDKLVPHIYGPVAFMFTNDSPYSIANYMAKNKVPAPAKAGQIAPSDVTVPKQNTGFPPGTIISQLNSVGLPTRIEEGTVAISEDTLVVEKGEKVSTTLASMLAQLDIEPFEVGLSLELVLEDGEIIEQDDLLVDFDEYLNNLVYAHQRAINLSVNAGILTKQTSPMVIGKAQQNAMALASSIGYITEETAPVVFGQAQSKALTLARVVKEIDDSAIPEEVMALAQTSSAPSAPASSAQTEPADEEEEEDEELEEGEEVDDEELGSLF